MMRDNPNCEGIGPHTLGEVRVLPADDGEVVILCRQCVSCVNAWKALKNERLTPDCKYDLPAWEDLEVYKVRP